MTAADTHADALATLRAALEVEEAATPGPWRVSVEGLQGGPVVRAKNARVARAYRCNYPDYVPDAENARAIVLARAILRPALEGSIETLEQHRPQRTTAPHYDPDCVGPHYGFTRWPCPDARRALAIADRVTEGGAL